MSSGLHRMFQCKIYTSFLTFQSSPLLSGSQVFISHLIHSFLSQYSFLSVCVLCSQCLLSQPPSFQCSHQSAPHKVRSNRYGMHVRAYLPRLVADTSALCDTSTGRPSRVSPVLSRSDYEGEIRHNEYLAVLMHKELWKVRQFDLIGLSTCNQSDISLCSPALRHLAATSSSAAISSPF